MKELKIRENPKSYNMKVMTFVFIFLMTILLWHFIGIAGLEIFVIVGFLGLLLNLYRHWRPQVVAILSAEGIKFTATQIMIPWQNVEEIKIEPHSEWGVIDDNKKDLVCYGYSTRADGIVEWWRLTTETEYAPQMKAEILAGKDYVIKNSNANLKV